MRLMHTKLPEFIKKMQVASTKANKSKELIIEGLENLKTAKMQSLRTGRIEVAIEELVQMENVEKVELLIKPRVPETEHTVIIKGINKDGIGEKAILETISILHGTDELYTFDCKTIEDRRSPIGRQG